MLEKNNEHLDNMIATVVKRPDQEQHVRDSIEIFHAMNFIKLDSESCFKRLPSVILIGIAKSGTRELKDFLRLHPHSQIYHGMDLTRWIISA